MPRFAYKARDPGGNAVESTIDAPTRRDALRMLAARGLGVSSVSESGGAAPARKPGGQAPEARGEPAPDSGVRSEALPRKAERLPFLESLHDLTSSGLSEGEDMREHQAEKISLGNVAKAVNMSAFYFCKMFKKLAGINFTDYLSRVRIERAQNLLLNPNLRVSEIAFEVGFQSLTHFNRVFKKITGQSPTDYRGQLLVP